MRELGTREELALQFSLESADRADAIRESAYSVPEDWEAYRPSTAATGES